MPSSAGQSVPELLVALLLALVQGVTEFLPVSSDGHLVLTQELLEAPGPRLATDVALHLGTLGAVLLVFRRDLRGVLARALAGDWSEVRLLLLASIPAAAVGLGFREVFAVLFESARAAALGLLGTAALLAVGERARRRSAARAEPGLPVDWRGALWIGCFQALAILPGVSRSGATIAVALARGVSAQEAARFSFLLSIPAVSGAVALEVPGLVRAGGFGWPLGVAVLATFLVGVCALAFLLRFLGRGAFLWCALYCAVLGTAVLALS
jgi:undecaprenyl-diphosphatase